MEERQIRSAIRTLERELKGIDTQREALQDALGSLKRLLPPEQTRNGLSVPSSKSIQEFPGLTAGILSIIEEAGGRPVPVGTIRGRFHERGWLLTEEGQDRSKTIYETLRRLKVKGRVEKLGKRGYVLPRNGQTVFSA